MIATIHTFTGRTFCPLDPKPEDIDIQDIAHALSCQCRFTGHSRKFYSVAEHCVRVSLLVSPDLQLAALLHDASEAYLSDVARPIKRLPAMAEYRRTEEALQRQIYLCFGCS